MKFKKKINLISKKFTIMTNTSIPISEKIYITVIPINCFITIFLNIISMIIFSKKEFRVNRVYKYLMIKSFINVIFLSTFLMYVPQQCNTIFPWSKKYPIFFEVLIRPYISRVLIMLNTLVSLTVVHVRYSTIKNSKTLRPTNNHLVNRIIIAYIFASFIYTLPSLFDKLLLLQKIGRYDTIFQVSSNFVTRLSGLAFVLQFFINAVPLVINFLLTYRIIKVVSLKTPQRKNFFVYTESWSSFSNVRKGNRKDSAFRNFKNNPNLHLKYDSNKFIRLKSQFTHMICSLSIVFTISHILFIITASFQSLINISDQMQLKFILSITHSIQILVTYLNVFIYLSFNKFYAFYFKNLLLMMFYKLFGIRF
jgi:hypothetical protein